MSILYALEHSTALCKQYDSSQIRKNDAKHTSVPLSHLETVIIGKGAGVSSGVLFACLRRGIPVHFLYREGFYAGSLMSYDTGNSPLRNRQYAIAFEPDQRLEYARLFVLGKMRNIAGFLANQDSGLNRDLIKGLIQKVQHCSSIEKLRGYEGMASRFLFQTLKGCIDSCWGFTKRSKHPPADAANAVISFAYAVLYSQVNEAVSAAGFDPFRGWLHSIKYGHPAFVSDCMELYRSPVADRVILKLLTDKTITPDQFSPGPDGDPGIYADSPARDRIITAMMDRLDTVKQYQGKRLTFRQWIRADLHALAQAVVKNIPWNPTPLYR